MAQWRNLLRDEFDAITPLLQPRPESADVYPRLDGSGGYYHVIRHAADDIVGICEDDGERIILQPSDLVIYRLDPLRLAARLASALGIDCEGVSVAECHATIRVGTLRPLAGFAFPIYLTMQLEAFDYRNVAASLLAMSPGPFILLAPTRQHHTTIARQLLDARGCLFLALDDAILHDAARWILSTAARAALDSFTARLLPQPDAKPAFFPTPSGASWSQLHIRFLDGHRITVKIGSETCTLNYTQMGMADGRNGEPTKQWELLRHFADGHGRMTWTSKGATRENQKRREKLAENLKSFFRIAGDPIRLLPDGDGWESLFTIESDR